MRKVRKLNMFSFKPPILLVNKRVIFIQGGWSPEESSVGTVDLVTQRKVMRSK